MTNYSSGHLAEGYACKYLEKLGYKIIANNWKTRYCEIDIIAEKKKTVHFIEVKYRQTSFQGTGLEYITPTKIRRMRFAAELWVSQNGWTENYVLSGIEVYGLEYKVGEFLPVLE